MNNLQQSNSIVQNTEVPLGPIQHNIENIPLSVAEINHLWLTYMAESMSETFVKYTLAKAEDPDYRNVLATSLETATKHLKAMEEVFRSINHPIPVAFGDKDVNIEARRLYDETSCVRYVKMMNRFIIQNHALALGECSRSDLIDLFSSFIDDSRNMIKMANRVLLEKGTYPKMPSIDIPSKIEFVTDKDYYGSLFGSDRPLNALEITSMEALLDFRNMIKIVKLGFAQVCQSDEIRDFFNDGANIADKYMYALRSILEKEGLPAPEIIDYRVTDSTEYTFSDRLMLYHTVTMISYILTSFGRGLSRVMRKDIATTYFRMMAEILTIAKSGADLLIKNGWLEEVPQTSNRQKLTH